MVLLRYCKTSKKGRIATGYMQTIITHIQCLFLGRSIKLPEPYMYPFMCFSIIQPLQASNIFQTILHETLKRDHDPFPIDPEF